MGQHLLDWCAVVECLMWPLEIALVVKIVGDVNAASSRVHFVDESFISVL